LVATVDFLDQHIDGASLAVQGAPIWARYVPATVVVPPTRHVAAPADVATHQLAEFLQSGRFRAYLATEKAAVVAALCVIQQQLATCP